MLKNEVVQKMSLNIKFSYLAENSKFSRSDSYFSILTFLRDGFLNSCFQNPSENSGSGNGMSAGLVSLVPFPWGQERNFLSSWNKNLVPLAKKSIQIMR